jgi:hypothetical protein
MLANPTVIILMYFIRHGGRLRWQIAGCLGLHDVILSLHNNAGTAGSFSTSTLRALV